MRELPNDEARMTNDESISNDEYRMTKQSVPNRIRHLTAQVLLFGSVLLATGCAKTRSTLTSPVVQPNPPPQMAADVTVRVQTLGRLADSFARLSNQLPGGSVEEHRRLLSQAFAQLEEILPM